MLWLCCCVAVSFLVLSAPMPTEAGYDRTCSPERAREGPVGHTLCGSQLTEAITTLCDITGVYATPNRRKRSETVPSPGLQAILSSREEALDYLGKRGHGPEMTGVVCECCYHRCSIGELMEYCALPERGNVDSPGEAQDTDSGRRW